MVNKGKLPGDKQAEAFPNSNIGRQKNNWLIMTALSVANNIKKSKLNSPSSKIHMLLKLPYTV